MTEFDLTASGSGWWHRAWIKQSREKAQQQIEAWLVNLSQSEPQELLLYI